MLRDFLLARGAAVLGGRERSAVRQAASTVASVVDQLERTARTEREALADPKKARAMMSGLELAKARAEAERAAFEAKVRAREERSGRAKGKHPKPPDDTPGPQEQSNLSDPDSRLMRGSKQHKHRQAQHTIDNRRDTSQIVDIRLMRLLSRVGLANSWR